MNAYCPRCGAQYREEFRAEWAETGLRCRECGLAGADAPAMLVPSDPDDEVEYDLGEWQMVERGEATNALLEADIPYRWEPHLVLVVPSVAEEEVDRLLEELDPVDELVEPIDAEVGESDEVDEDVDVDEPAGAVVVEDTVVVEDAVVVEGDVDEGVEDADDFEDDFEDEFDEDEDEDEDEDWGEQAQEAMSELFVAADRLQHAPTDPQLAADLLYSAGMVTASSPPYGIQRPVWRRIQDLATALVTEVEAEPLDEDAVASGARALREYLRDLV